MKKQKLREIKGVKWVGVDGGHLGDSRKMKAVAKKIQKRQKK